MVTIGEKEVLFETNVLVRPSEIAVITTPDAHSVSFRFECGAAGVMPTDAEELRPVMVSGVATFKIPFLPTNFTLASTNDVEFQGNEMEVLIAARGEADFTLIHVQCRGARA